MRALWGLLVAGLFVLPTSVAAESPAVAVVAAAKAHVRVVYAFRGGSDGQYPEGSLIADAFGALYGTTQRGGGSPNCEFGCGTVFKLTPGENGFSERVLYRFGNPLSGACLNGACDGSEPGYGVIMDKSGALYGATAYGGTSPNCYGGCGAVFKLTPVGNDYKETVLHSFQGSDGLGPTGGLVADSNGALYGTTQYGGDLGCDGGSGCGVAYKLTPGRSGYAFSIVHTFEGTDGALPFGSPIIDAGGGLYGTTFVGGALCACGTVFKLTPTPSGYQESVLHSFSGSDGLWPQEGLIADASGALYGTTVGGGTAKCRRDVYCGVVFKVTPSKSGYTTSVLHNFQGGNHGASNSKQRLTLGADGTLFGTTVAGGPDGGGGTIFELTPIGAHYFERILYFFGGGARRREVRDPVGGGMLLGSKGELYGTSALGGNTCGGDTCGVIYMVQP